MWKKIGIAALIALAVLGGVFLVLRLALKSGEKELEAASIPESETEEEAVFSLEQPEEGIVSFQTTTLDGEKVTDEIFSDYELTIVHVWGTYCGPCIQEMPEIAAFEKELPSNVNLVGLICDVYDGIDANEDIAREILDGAGAEFLNLRVNDNFYNVLNRVQFIPTSFFVDGKGQIVGEIMEGVPFEEVAEHLEEYIG